MNELVLRQCESLSCSDYPISSITNILSVLFYELPDISWCGLYYMDTQSNVLYLGPFQGKPACMQIPYGKGVVGTAAKERKTIIVENVHEFPGHIACDCASQSEMVVPLFHEGRLLAILDLDSDQLNNFKSEVSSTISSVASLLAREVFREME